MDRLRDDKSYSMHMCKNTQGGVCRTYLMQCRQRKHNQSVREGERERKERRGDRRTEMTSWHGFFLHVQWDVGYSCRAASVGYTVAESAPWWITGPNSRQFLCLNTSEEHPEKPTDGCWWMSCGRSEGTNRAKAQTSGKEPGGEGSHQIQQIASKDAVFVPHLPYIRKQCKINCGLARQ